jgi:hypothetical protein
MTVDAILERARNAGVSITPRFNTDLATEWATITIKGRLTDDLRGLLAGAKWAIIAAYLEPQLTQVLNALCRLEGQGKVGERTYDNLTGHFTNLRAGYELCHISMQRQEVVR